MDCFISYSHKDSAVAREIHAALDDLEIEAFLAEFSLKGGDNWTDEVWSALRSAKFVVFLASEESCKSAFVLQELGGARYGEKKIVPIVWDISPADLPGWVNQSHAIDLRHCDSAAIRTQFTAVISDIRAGKWDLLQIILAVAAFVAFVALASRLASRSDSSSADPLACPNCSVGGSIFRMSPIPPDFHAFEGATHECSKCKYKTKVESV